MTGAVSGGHALFLFGPLRITHAGTVLRRPRGNQAKTLALLTLNGRCMNRDTLAERLWPGMDADRSRHQLRNVLAQLRRSAGMTIERQDELVVLCDPIWCDVEMFIRIATRALALPDEPDAARLALDAQDLWGGPPLEAWRHEDWAMPIRQRVFALREQLWAMLDQRARTLTRN